MIKAGRRLLRELGFFDYSTDKTKYKKAEVKELRLLKDKWESLGKNRSILLPLRGSMTKLMIDNNITECLNIGLTVLGNGEWSIRDEYCFAIEEGTDGNASLLLGKKITPTDIIVIDTIRVLKDEM